jgi:hypothetical protein
MRKLADPKINLVPIHFTTRNPIWQCIDKQPLSLSADGNDYNPC